MSYHVHRHAGMPVLRHRHDGDDQPHGHHGYAFHVDQPAHALAADGHRIPGEVSPVEDMVELPIRRAYLDEARAALPAPSPPAREPRRIPTSAHDLGRHELCGPDCEERADG